MADARVSSLLDPALLERVKGLALVARRVVEGALHGLHRSPVHGLSIEFAEHRAYTPGDELKHLDWRVLGRSDRYVIKRYEQETNMRVVLMCDCSRSMAYGAKPAAGQNGDSQGKFDYAQVMAAALSYLLLQQGDSVGLVLTSDRIVEQVPPRAAPGHVLSICQALEKASPKGVTDLPGVVSQIAARLQRRSLVILISDLLDEPATVLAALGQLAHRGHEVVVFHVLDPREIEFELGLAGLGVTVLRDMETGEEFEAEPQLIRELVRAEVRRFCQQLDAGTRAHGVHLVRCRTDEPAEGVLMRYLHWRLHGRRM